MPRARTGTPVYKAGRWQAKLTHDGKRIYVDLQRPDIPNTPAGHQQAKELVASLASAASTMTLAKPVHKPPATTLVRDVAVRWLALLEARGCRDGNRTATRRAKTGAVKLWIIPELGDLDVTDLTVARVRDFVRLVASKTSAKQTERALYSLRGCLDDAMAEGWIPLQDNPAAHRTVAKELPKPKRQHVDDIAVCKPEHLNALLHCERIDQLQRIWYLMAVTTGMRCGELYGLSWSRVKPDRIEVIEQHVQNNSTPQPLKTASSRRIIPLHPALQGVLRFISGTGLVFGKRPSHPSDALHEALVLAGVEASYTTQVFRHTFATMLGSASVDGASIDRLLGHSATSIRMRYYQASDLEHLARQVARLPMTHRDESSLEAYLQSIEFTTTAPSNPTKPSGCVTTPGACDATMSLAVAANNANCEQPRAVVVVEKTASNSTDHAVIDALQLRAVVNAGTIQVRLLEAMTRAVQAGQWDVAAALASALR